jgi:sulfatase maturation enzyme AslB (radical SAM superfamily)
MNLDTFCAAPWFSLRIDWDGHYRPCCQLQEQKSEFNGQTQYSLHDTTVDQWMSSEYSQYLRQQLTQGVKLPECATCWKKEQHGIYSLRQTSNELVTNNRSNELDNTWVKLFVKKNPTAQQYRIISADVKLSNVCNFSCAMCFPHDSSKIYDHWQKDIDNKFVQQQLATDPVYFETIKQNYQTQKGYQRLIDLLEHPLTHFKLLGGEPLLDKGLMRVLTEQSVQKKSQINLHFITNGSVNLVQAVEQLKDYRSVSFSISLEGVGSMQDYARAGSDWLLIERHILEAKQNGISLSVNHTLQAVTVLKLADLLKWCYSNQIAISFTALNHPNYLSISVLPDTIRQQAIDNLELIGNINLLSTENNKNNNNTLSIDSIKNMIKDQPDDSSKYSEFLQYIAWYERNLPIKLSEICPELSH